MGRLKTETIKIAPELLHRTPDAAELTRQEYIQMLQTVRGRKDPRGYILTKLFASTGLAVSELPLVTMETVRQGNPLRYASQSGRADGMIFTKKNGTPMERTQVSFSIQKLTQEAKLPAEKGNIRALRQMEAEQLSVGWRE